MKNISFAAGIFITFLFLEMFPLLFQQSFSFTQISLIFMLFGFSLFHIIQKYEYKHVSRKRLRKEIKELHSLAFFIYHFVVGIILVIALLTIPAALARQFTSSLKKMMLLAVIFGAVFTFSGLWLSYILDLASGATIILVSGTVLLLSFGISRCRLLRKTNC